MDFLYQQPTFPFLLPTPCIIDGPLEFPWANNGHIASWSEVGNQEGSSPRQKEEMEAARKSLPNFCTVVVQWQRCNLLLNDVPGLSGISLLSSMPLLLLPSSTTLLPLLSCTLLLLIFSALLTLPLFRLDS